MQLKVERLNRLRFCFISTAIIAFICHGYRYFNLSYSGDATLIYQTGEELYLISLGRFLQPLWWTIRGSIVAPFLIGVFSIFFLSLSAFIILEVFHIEPSLAGFLICGLLTASETIGIANGTYLPWADVYTVSLFFALLGAMLSLRDDYTFLFSPFCFLLSLGLYQSYISCAATCIVVALLRDCLSHRRSLREIWTTGIRSCFLLLMGLLLYAAVLKAVLHFLQVEASTDYNGVGRVGMVSFKELLSLLKEAWSTPVHFLLDPNGRAILPWHVSAVPVYINWVFVGGSILAILACKPHGKTAFTSIFLILILPLSANFVMVISKGVVNGLMIYSWSFLYLLPLLLIAGNKTLNCQKQLMRLACIASSLLIAINTVTCNQIYIKRDLELDATHSAFTRIINRAENTRDYHPGVTPVVLVGMLPSSLLSMNRIGFEALSRLQGMRYTYGAAYETSEYWYLSMILGAPINLVPHEDRIRLIRETQAESILQRYPNEGSVQMIDGKLFIRF